jgi:hypothetical protein
MPKRQAGAALIVILAGLAVGAAWFVVSRINSSGGNYTAANRTQNAAVLNRAKQALIGYVAAQAVKSGEDNPGALPCPEAPGSFNSITGTDGKAQTPSCALPVVGRFPWRTIGTEQFADASGEPLWYVVSPAWAKATASGNTIINSNSVGQLTVDGVTNAAVALIIAPGPAFSVSASGAACAAISQVRPNSGTPDWRNYLECENATNPANATFVTTGPSGSFNDQVVKITAADLLPGIEAAISQRIEREIAPALKTAYAANWGLGKPLYPYAAAFSDPGTATYKGAAATYRGLFPVTHATASGATCIPATGAACDPMHVAWQAAPAPTFTRTGGATLVLANCGVTTVTVNASPLAQTTQIDCNLVLYASIFGGNSMDFTITGTAQNVGMALRQIDTTVAMGNVDAAPRTASGTLNSNGSANITFSGTAATGGGIVQLGAVCGLGGFAALLNLCYSRTISIPITLLADHPVINSTDSTYGWFTRNEWHRLAYYAVAQGHTVATLPAAPTCTTAVNCITVTNVTPTSAQRAILIVAGRSVNGSARPSATLSDYLEFANATATGTAVAPFERQTVSTANAPALKKPFNDRIAVVDSN